MKEVVISHPLVEDNLAVLRDKRTPAPEFRRRIMDTASLLGYIVLGNLRTKKVMVKTPLGPAPCRRLAEGVTLVSVLRAGLGLVDGLLRIAPEARIGQIGLYRDEETLNPVQYYVKLPPKLENDFVLLADPMLATGGSAIESVSILKDHGARRIAFLSLIAAPEGIRNMQRAHPDVPVYTGGLDKKLNKKGYILPGLGDAGDRIFGT